MGVTNLWQILQPIARPLSINEIENKTIAIDLSIWICENSSIQYGTNPCIKPYLRTLFFRCKSLIELGCKLVFVSEGICENKSVQSALIKNIFEYSFLGEIIQLKQKTMEKRVNNRFGFKTAEVNGTLESKTDLTNLKSKKIKRGHFDVVVSEVSDDKMYSRNEECH